MLSFEVEDKLDSFYSGDDIAVSGHIYTIVYSTVISSNYVDNVHSANNHLHDVPSSSMDMVSMYLFC